MIDLISFFAGVSSAVILWLLIQFLNTLSYRRKFSPADLQEGVSEIFNAEFEEYNHKDGRIHRSEGCIDQDTNTVQRT